MMFLRSTWNKAQFLNSVRRLIIEDYSIIDNLRHPNSENQTRVRGLKNHQKQGQDKPLEKEHPSNFPVSQRIGPMDLLGLKQSSPGEQIQGDKCQSRDTPLSTLRITSGGHPVTRIRNIHVPPNEDTSSYDIQDTCHCQVRKIHPPTPRTPVVTKEEVTGHLPRGAPELGEQRYKPMAPEEGISPEP